MADGGGVTQDAIFERIWRSAKADPEFAGISDPRNFDPVLRVLWEAVAGEIALLHKGLGDTARRARDEIISALLNDGRRYPVPALTVMHVEPSDDGAEVSADARFETTIELPTGSMRLTFTPLATADRRVYPLTSARVACTVAVTRDDWRRVIFDPFAANPLTPAAIDAEGDTTAAAETALYVAIHYDGDPENLKDTPLYIHYPGTKQGEDHDLTRALRWSRFTPSGADGRFEPSTGWVAGENWSFAPGSYATEPGRLDPKVGWSELRTWDDLYENPWGQFISFPLAQLDDWPACDGEPLAVGVDDTAFDLPEGKYRWLKITLPPSVAPERLERPPVFAFNCFPAINARPLTEKWIPSLRLMADNYRIRIPKDEYLFRIAEVEDAAAEFFTNDMDMHAPPSKRSFRSRFVEEDVELWFDWARSGLSKPPEWVRIEYQLTRGEVGNRVVAGKVVDTFESYPMIERVTNLTTARGASDPRPLNASEMILPSRLRQISPTAAQWVTAEDLRERIIEFHFGLDPSWISIERVVLPDADGPLHGVVARLNIPEAFFDSEAEREGFAHRLQRFLERLAPVNCPIALEVHLGAA